MTSRTVMPLDGVRVATRGHHPACLIASACLSALGAQVGPARDATLVLDDDRIRDSPVADAGIPRGTIDLATGVLLAGAMLLRADAAVDRGDIARHIYLPLLMAGERPGAPLPVGDGFVCADLAADGDADAFDRLVESLGGAAGDAEALAAAAQEWRLPVTPYRRRRAGAAVPWLMPPIVDTSVARPRRPRLRVLDMTVMWSGPLATHLLCTVGADVVKVEPRCRPDGMRRSTTGLFDALQHGKDVADLDLTDPPQYDEFMRLVEDADVIIDNFSPRVRENLGIGHRRLHAVNQHLVSVSMPAFPAGVPERDWVSYGTGVHAMSGLGDVADGDPMAPVVTYPDPLAGIAAFTTIAAHLHRNTGVHAEVSLRSSVEPLLSTDDDGASLAAPPPELSLDGLPHVRMLA